MALVCTLLIHGDELVYAVTQRMNNCQGYRSFFAVLKYVCKHCGREYLMSHTFDGIAIGENMPLSFSDRRDSLFTNKSSGYSDAANRYIGQGDWHDTSTVSRIYPLEIEQLEDCAIKITKGQDK